MAAQQHPLSVCVYCGSREGGDPAFVAEARALGAGLAARGWRLVYGAGDQGIMGTVAGATMAEGGATMGVIPEHLLPREGRHAGLGTYVVTETMHERKKVMERNSDAIVVLPGGAGTLDEFFEVLTWRQLGLHAKPIVVVNVGGVWDPLVALIDGVIGHGFADPSLRDFVTVTADAAGALAVLEAG
jgi:hypothetical protein